MRTRLARRMVVVLAVVAMFTLGGSVVMAAIPNSGGTIYACYAKTTGAMRVVDYPRVHCASTERLLNWTQIGPKAPPLASIGVYTAVLDPTLDYREAQSGGAATVLSVFVETGSTNTACLATLNEMWYQAGGGPANVERLFCASRNPTIGGVVRHGAYLHVFLDGDVGAPAPGNPNYLNLQINVYQEGAQYYRAPVYCGVNCGE